MGRAAQERRDSPANQLSDLPKNTPRPYWHCLNAAGRSSTSKRGYRLPPFFFAAAFLAGAFFAGAFFAAAFFTGAFLAAAFLAGAFFAAAFFAGAFFATDLAGAVTAALAGAATAAFFAGAF